MAERFLTWNTTTNRHETVRELKGLSLSGRFFTAVADEQALTVDATSGITIVAGGLEDRFLQQITTANKVAGSAVELQTIANGGLSDNSGLGLVIDTDMFSFEATSGLQLDYNADEFQFIPGTGLTINAIGTSKLPSTLVLTDGTRPFTQPQGGVAAVAGSDLTTLTQVQALVAGGSFETILNLSGQNIAKGQVGYVENVSGGVFRLARADDPSTAIVQYAAAEAINDGASGTFYSVPAEVDDVNSFVSGINVGSDLYLSTTQWGLFQSTPPSVSGETILKVGFKKRNDNGYSFNPEEPIDL